MISINLLIAFYAFFYFFSYYYSNYEDDRSFDEMYKPYNLVLSGSGGPENDRNDIQDMITILVNDENIPDIIKITVHSQFSEDGNTQDIIGLYMNLDKYRSFFVVEKGVFFDSVDLHNLNRVAFLSEKPFDSKYEKYSVNDSIEINETEFRIAGKGFSDFENDAIYLPHESFVDCGFEINEVNINFERRLDKNELKYLIVLFNDLDGFYSFLEPVFDRTGLVNLSIQLSLIVGVIVLAATSIISIFRFLTINNLGRFTVFILCGMSPIKKLICILVDIMTFIGVLYMVAILLFEMSTGYIGLDSISCVQYMVILFMIGLIVSVITGVNYKTILNNTMTEKL
jgi:hypothetical protein